MEQSYDAVSSASIKMSVMWQRRRDMSICSCNTGWLRFFAAGAPCQVWQDQAFWRENASHRLSCWTSRVECCQIVSWACFPKSASGRQFFITIYGVLGNQTALSILRLSLAMLVKIQSLASFDSSCTRTDVYREGLWCCITASLRYLKYLSNWSDRLNRPIWDHHQLLRQTCCVEQQHSSWYLWSGSWLGLGRYQLQSNSSS